MGPGDTVGVEDGARDWVGAAVGNGEAVGVFEPTTDGATEDLGAEDCFEEGLSELVG